MQGLTKKAYNPQFTLTLKEMNDHFRLELFWAL